MTDHSELKRKVLEALVASKRAGVDSEADDIGEEHDAAEVITDDSVAFEDKAQSSEELGIAAPLEAAAAQAEAELERLEDLDPTPTDRVGIGSVVVFGGDHYVAGVVASPFTADGVTYEGLSADSPIYAEIVGLRAGDTFTFRGAEHRLELVV